MDAERHEDAITCYSPAIALGQGRPRELFIRRSKAHMAKGLWKDGLSDAKQVSYPYGL